MVEGFEVDEFIFYCFGSGEKRRLITPIGPFGPTLFNHVSQQ
jgi:hypothetical protein